MGEIDAALGVHSTQLRQLEASAHNDEVESNSFEQKIESLRERMNNARTSKEHAALLSEINTLKADKSLIEDRAIKSMQKLDEVRVQVQTLETARAERAKVRDVAAADREARAAEIKDRVAELEAERVKALEDIPPAALLIYEERVAMGDDESIMAPIEEQDRRSLEYTCGSCYTHLPIEQVSILLKRGDVTKCPSCKVILFMEEELRDSINTAQQKKRKTVGIEDA